MAKKGLAYYFVASLGFLTVPYFIYKEKDLIEYNKQFASDEEKVLKFEGKSKLVSVNEMRIVGERKKVDTVPVCDDKQGYM